MDFASKKRLMELKKLFGYDLAQAQKEMPEMKDESDEEILRFLAYYEFQNEIADSINTFYDKNLFFKDEEVIGMAVTCLANILGGIIEAETDNDFRAKLKRVGLKMYKKGAEDVQRKYDSES